MDYCKLSDLESRKQLAVELKKYHGHIYLDQNIQRSIKRLLEKYQNIKKSRNHPNLPSVKQFVSDLDNVFDIESKIPLKERNKREQEAKLNERRLKEQEIIDSTNPIYYNDQLFKSLVSDIPEDEFIKDDEIIDNICTLFDRKNRDFISIVRINLNKTKNKRKDRGIVSSQCFS